MSLTIDLELPTRRTPGFINAGRTVYQIKWRTRREHIVNSARGELSKLRRSGQHPTIYVFVTNIILDSRGRHAIKKALRVGHAGFPVSKIVIMGGSELRDRVISDPRVQLTHFRVHLGVSTLEHASKSAELRYRQSDEPPEFVGRRAELNVAAEYVKEERGRVLAVYGPQGSGKTRLIIESLRGCPEQVVWARAVPVQPEGLMRVLDEAPADTVLVIDDANRGRYELARWALERTKLKTILICALPVMLPSVTALPLPPLEYGEADALLQAACPRLTIRQRMWLQRECGRLPGLLMQAAMVLNARESLEMEERGLAALFEGYAESTMQETGDERLALELMACFPSFKVSEGHCSEIEQLSRALGREPGDVLGQIDVFTRRGLVEAGDFRRDGEFRVAPPLLARQLGARVISRLGDRLKTLYERLSRDGRAGLVTRAVERRSDPIVLEFLRWLFAPDALFRDLDSMANDAPTVRALALGVPSRTGRELLRVLESTAVRDRQVKLIGKAREEITFALESLVNDEESFGNGVRGMLCLAEDEDKPDFSGAAGYFVAAFHWRNPNPVKDGLLRLDILRRLAKSDSAGRRQIVAKAATHALESQSMFHVWQDHTPGLPPPNWQPKAWGEVHQVARKAVEVLKALSSDEVVSVRSEAIRGLMEGPGALLSVGAPEEAIEVLEYASSLHLDTPQRAELVERCALLVSNLRKVLPAQPDPTAELIRRGQALFDQLTSGDFLGKFRHWLGPTPLRAFTRLGEEHTYKQVGVKGAEIAAEVIESPALFNSELQDWITGPDAHSSGYFLMRLGELDRERIFLPALEARLHRPNGVGVLGTYVAGWHSSHASEATAYLDSITARGGKWSEAGMDGTLRVGDDPGSVQRLLLGVGEGRASRTSLAMRLTWAGWIKALQMDDFVKLIGGLRDGSAAVDWALVEAVRWRWSEGAVEDRGHLLSVARPILLNTVIGRPQGESSYHWDSLAAAIVELDFGFGLELLLAHLQAEEGPHGVFLAHDRNQLIQALSSRRRDQLIRRLLGVAMDNPHGWKIKIELADLLHPEVDAPIILEFIKERGLDAARFVSGELDADRQGFWDLVTEIVVLSPDDEEVRTELLSSITSIRGVYSGKKNALEPRLEHLDRLSRHTNPYVKDLARQAAKRIRSEMERDET